MVCSISSVPSAISECVFCSTNQVTPAEFMPLPTMEIKLAAKISRIPRCCRMLRTSNHFSITRNRLSALLCRPQPAIIPAMLGRRLRAVSIIAISAAALAAGASMREAVKPFSVYHDGDDLIFTPEMAGKQRLASVGPWNLGERVAEDKPVDKRLNLYFVAPGMQYRAAGKSEYDHNFVVNKYTVDGKPRDWDIFWCFILDPTLRPDLRSERELLLAKHQTFRPPTLFEFKDIPSHALLAERLSIKSMADLRALPPKKWHSAPSADRSCAHGRPRDRCCAAA